MGGRRGVRPFFFFLFVLLQPPSHPPTLQDPLPTSLLKLPGDAPARAVKQFAAVLRFTGDDCAPPPTGGDAASSAAALLATSLKRADLRDELYASLVKQTRGEAAAPPAALRAWVLLRALAAVAPPSPSLAPLVTSHIHAAASAAGDPAVADAARGAWTALRASSRAGPRRAPPTEDEASALLAGAPLSAVVFFLDGSVEELTCDPVSGVWVLWGGWGMGGDKPLFNQHPPPPPPPPTLPLHQAATVLDAVEAVASSIGLEHCKTFALYADHSAAPGSASPVFLSPAASPAASPRPADPSFASTSSPHILLDDSRYVADVLAELRAGAGAKGRPPPRLLFKKRMFRETDEGVTEPTFIRLSYVQAAAEYGAGAYPVVRDDAAQLAALAAAAAGGEGLAPLLSDGDDAAADAAVAALVPRAVAATRKAADWRADVRARARALAGAGLTPDDARLGFLRLLRSLPYGGSLFFPVKRVEDPIGLLPAKLLLGVNKRGVHFFRPVSGKRKRGGGRRRAAHTPSPPTHPHHPPIQTPVEYLHSTELRDIMQFGSSAAAVFFKMRVAGVLHVFQFETKAGEDICLALQTHINDVMMKRYARAKAAAAIGGGGGGDGAQDDGAASSHTVSFGPKYEAHVAELQRQVDAARAAASAAEARAAAAEAAAAEAADSVDAAAARADAAASAATAAARELGGGGASGDLAAALVAARAAAAAAEAERDALAVRVKTATARASDVAAAAAASPPPAYGDTRAAELRVNELVEELGSAHALLAERDAAAALAAAAATELAELRDLAADVARREVAQATIISRQAARLEELEAAYAEADVARKRAHNALEDAKGKIRVYARVRPLLPGEQECGSALALTFPNALTLAHEWKGTVKSYNFDSVFPPSASQAAVFDDTRHLIQSALDGYNVVVFAYGQTGSGKTHTVYGSEGDPGLAPRAVAELFRLLDDAAGRSETSVCVQMLELYQDDLVDLQAAEGGGGGNTPRARLEIKRDAKGVVAVPGAVLRPVATAADLMDAVTAAAAARRVSATKMNAASSRSHLIVSIHTSTTDAQTQAVTRGKLTFVDLAGSERLKKSGSTGDAQKEAAAINKSLSALGDVVAALASGASHVPYRNHKLTLLLSDCIGGSAKALMFVNVAPSAYNLDESANSLQYAARVRTIKNAVSRDAAPAEVVRLRRALDVWKARAGLVRAEARAEVDLGEIEDVKGGGEVEGAET